MIEGLVTTPPPEARRWTTRPSAAGRRYLECLARGDELGLDEEVSREVAVVEADLVNHGAEPGDLPRSLFGLVLDVSRVFEAHVVGFEERRPEPVQESQDGSEPDDRARRSGVA